MCLSQSTERATPDLLRGFLSDKIQAGPAQDEGRCALPLSSSPGQPGSQTGPEREQACERGGYGGVILLRCHPFAS